MKNDARKKFGLDEDELIAVIFAFLITLVVALFLLRGCRPNADEINRPGGENGNGIAPTVDVPIIKDDFQGGNVTWKGNGEPNQDIDLYLNERRIATVRADGTGRWLYDGGELEAGNYQLQASSKGSDGQLLRSEMYPFAVLSSLAMKPLSAEADAGMLDARYGNGELKLAGKSDPYAKFDVWLNGSKIGTTSADGVGNWRFSSPVTEAGQYQLQIAKAGADLATANQYQFNVSEGSRPNPTEIAQITKQSTSMPTATVVPTSAPTSVPPTATPGIAPSIDSKFQGATMPLGDVLISGKGQPNSVIELILNEAVVGTAAVGPDGNWQYGWALEPGNYTVQARSTDDSALASLPIQLIVSDLNAPSIQALPIDIGADVVKLTGKGEPNATLTILQDGAAIGTVVTGADGAWSFDVPLDRTEDQRLYRFVATTNDQNGDVVESNPIEVRVFPEGTDPTTPDVTTAAPTETVFAVDVIGVESGIATGSEVSFVGRTTPNTPIKLFFEDGKTIDVVTDDNGVWSYTLSELNAGSYGVVIRPILPEGSEELPEFATKFVVEALPTTEATSPAEISTAEPTAMPTTEMTAEPTAMPTTEVTAEPTAMPTTEVTAEPTVVVTSTEFSFDSAELGGLQFGNGVNDALGQLLVQGRGTPGARVELYENASFFNATNVQPDGTWRLAIEYNRPIGDYYFMSVMFINGERIANSEEKILTVPEFGLLEVVYDKTATADSSGGKPMEVGELPTVELILDSSWSMTQALEDRTGTRVGIARLVLSDIVTRIIPEGALVALRSFGNIEGDYSCRTDLMQPVAPLDPVTMNQIIQDVYPKVNANTPLGASLEKVAEDLAGVEGKKIVVLLTDGEETCNGDPALEIQKLVEQGIDVQINIVGFSIAQQELKQEFQRWAELGGGEYYDANNRNDLQSALSTLFGVQYQVFNNEGEMVAKGVINDRPLALKPGDYRVQLNGDSTQTIDVTIKSAETLQLPVK